MSERRPKLTVKNWTKNRWNDALAREEGYVWLQEVGYVEAKPLQDFQVGERMGWNGGSTSVVVDFIRNQRGTVVGVVERSDKGTEYRRTRRGTTLTAWAH